jgi:trehalose 6-phosphate synthase
VTWIASAATDEDRVVAADGVSEDGVLLLAHEPAVYDRFYNVISNPLLWFIQHSLWGLASRPDLDRDVHEAWDHGYVTVNEAFATAVVAQLDDKPDALVFFHDYHLYLAPRLVRDARPDALLAHFVHIPWPTDWSVLPRAWRDAIHGGLLANDVLGFHTERWARNFRATCGGVGSTLVTHHPISVDSAEFDELSASAPVLAAEQALAAKRPEKLIVRVDRTDPAKNIVRGFKAYGMLLDERPEWHGRVTMLALLDPSRQSVPEYVDYLAAVEREAGEVNRRFGRPDWLPIELVVADDFPRSVAAYKQFDVLFVNAVYDGLNLVAKEAPLVNVRNGALILSENAGAHEELGDWAITVNPFDLVGQAAALHEALTMDEDERARRSAAISSQVREHDLAAWLAALLADVEDVSRNVRP